MFTRNRTVLQIAVLIILGSLIFALSTPFGIGIQPDTRGYFEVAENFAQGDGLTFDSGQPLKRWAPLYSMIVGVVTLLGVSTATAAWWVNLVVFLAGGLVFAQLIREFVWQHNNSAVAFALSFFAYILTMDMLERYTIALSEGMFVTCCVVGAYFCLRYVSRPGTRTLLLFTTFFLIALMSRFIAIFLLVPALFTIWLLASQAIADKIKHSLLYGVIFLTPALAWYIRGKVLQGPVLPYVGVPVPPPTPDLGLQAVQNTSSWFLTRSIPTQFRAVLAALLVGLLVGALFLKWRRDRNALTLTMPQRHFALLALAILAVYGGTITVTMTFIAVGVTPTSRYLMPMIPFALGLLILAFVLLFDLQSVTWNWSPPRIALTIIVTLLFVQGLERVWLQNQNGVGHFTRDWVESELVAFVETLSRDKVFYSNEENHFAVVTGIPMIELPQLEKYGRPTLPESYDRLIMEMLDDFAEQGGGYVVIYTNISNHRYQALNFDYVISLPGLELLQEFDDGLVLEAR